MKRTGTEHKYFLFLIIFFIPVLVFSESIFVNGLKRKYVVFVPKCYDSKKEVPLLIVLHGGGGKAKSFVHFSGYNKIANRDTFIVVYPQAYSGHWNDGRKATRYESQKENINDVNFISTLIDEMENKLHLNKNKIYVTGFSNGGMLCYKLACELGNKISAIAPVISNMPENLFNTCHPSNAMPVIIMNGTADPLMPYDGGEIRFLKLELGKVVSTFQTVMFWVKNNNCKAEPLTTELADLNVKDKCTIYREIFGNSDNHSEVVLYSICGGGHTLPGASQYLPKYLIGGTCRDINGAEVIWNFLKNH